MPTNLSMHIPIKFCHVHKTKFTHANKLFPHASWTYSSKPTTNFSHCQYSQNLNQNSSNNITIYPHCQNPTSYQHCPNCTMIKNKKKIKKKNTPRMLQNQLITQCPKLQQPNDNISPSNFEWNMKQHFSMKRNQRKTHLGVYMTIRSIGPSVLKKPMLIMPIKCGITFFTIKSKKRGSLGWRSHLDAKKNGFHLKWVCGENAKKHKDLKKYWWRWMREC